MFIKIFVISLFSIQVETTITSYTMNYQTRLDEIMERYGIPIGGLEEASNLLIIDKTLKAFSDFSIDI